MTVAPVLEPLTLVQAKAFLKVDGTDEDDLITSLIASARQACEDHCRRAFLPQTWKLVLDAFPCGRHPIDLPFPPLVSVSSISYVNNAGDDTAFDLANVRVDDVSEPGRIAPKVGVDWPVAQCVIGAVTVVYAAGFPNAAALPPAIVQAVRFTLTHFFENRSSVEVGTIATEVPNAVKSILSPWRVW